MDFDLNEIFEENVGTYAALGGAFAINAHANATGQRAKQLEYLRQSNLTDQERLGVERKRLEVEKQQLKAQSDALRNQAETRQAIRELRVLMLDINEDLKNIEIN